MSELGGSAVEQTLTLPGDRTVTLSWAAATDTGRHRDHNEDSYLSRTPVFAVADGMGGHSAGDFASARVVARLGELSGHDSVDGDEVDLALARATDDIIPVAELSLRGIGTTVTGAAITVLEGEPQWLVFNVGDSRTYQYHDGALTQITVDHSVVQQMVEAGLITAEQAEHHPDSNIITRAVGFEPDPESDRFYLPIRAGMRLLICSDGLTKELDAAAIAEELSAVRSVDQIAAHLMDRALGREARDNITVIVIEVDAVTGIDDATDPSAWAPGAAVSDDTIDLKVIRTPDTAETPTLPITAVPDGEAAPRQDEAAEEG